MNRSDPAHATPEEGDGRAHHHVRAQSRMQRGLADLQILVVLGLIFLVPVAITTYFLVQKQREEIAFAEKEITGAQYAAQLRALSQAVARHRNAAKADAGKLVGEVKAISPRSMQQRRALRSVPAQAGRA